MMKCLDYSKDQKWMISDVNQNTDEPLTYEDKPIVAVRHVIGGLLGGFKSDEVYAPEALRGLYEALKDYYEKKGTP